MRSLRLITAPALAALALSACTAEDPAPPAPPAPTATDDAAVTTDDGLEGGVGTNGYLCNYVSPSATEAAAGGTAETPRERIVRDDEDGWVCEVLSGGPGEQAPVIRLSILLGEDARNQARETAESADGVEAGPDYLGLSFVSPGLVTGLTSCAAPDAATRADQIPYTLLGEGLGVVDDETTDDLRSALSSMAQNLDRGLGCMPKQAREDQAAATSAP